MSQDFDFNKINDTLNVLAHAVENLLKQVAEQQQGLTLSAHKDSEILNEVPDMAILPSAFNAHLIDPAASVGQLPVCPEGMPVIISASEFKAAKSGGNNYFVELTLSVIDGPHKGESGPYRLNLGNDNEVAVRIANQQLSALCHVTGQMNISDTNQLHNIPFVVCTSGKTNKNAEGVEFISSEIKKVLDIRGNAPGKTPAAAAAPAPAFAAPVAQAAPAAAPWAVPAAAAPAFAPSAAAPAAGAPSWATK